MSKKWTPELDSILLHGVLEECQVSFGKALCEKIAERVRAAGVEGFTECTPKAVENRLYSWKKKNATAAPSTAGAATDTPTATPKKGTARVKKDPATPKMPRAKKGAKAETEDEESKAAGRKRTGSSEEGESKEKKVKLEDVDGEEGGVGLGADSDADQEV